MLTFLFLSGVSTLPIRNGNINNTMSNAKAANSKYLTYKEWKLFGFRDLTYFITLVSTLPIRNGNLIRKATIRKI